MGKRYKVVFDKSFDGTIRKNKYAEVIDTKENRIILEAFYVINNLQRYGYSIASGHKGDKCIVTFDKRYLDYFINKPSVFEPLIMHELGHYLNGDSRRKANNETIRKDRALTIEQGKVPQRELDADSFAVSQVGKKAVRNALKYVRNDCLRQGVSRNNQGIIEVERRIEALK